MAPKKKPKATGGRPYPDEDRIRHGIERCRALLVPWQGSVYRATSQEYANRRDAITGEGSRRAGARYTPQGAFRAVYGALQIETALAARRHRGLPDAEATPLTFVALRLDLGRVLDLTDGKVRQALGVSRYRLRAAWRPDQEQGVESVTQAVGRLARAAGFEGILYVSAQHSTGWNLVVFPDLLRPGQMELVNQEQLPAQAAAEKRLKFPRRLRR